MTRPLNLMLAAAKESHYTYDRIIRNYLTQTAANFNYPLNPVLEWLVTAREKPTWIKQEELRIVGCFKEIEKIKHYLQ